MDVTEIRQSKLALQDSEARFSTAFHTSTVAMMITGEYGKIVEANYACCTLFNRPLEDIVGKTLMDLGLLTAAEREEFLSALQRAGGSLRNIERRIPIPDGSYRDIVYSTTAVPLNGRPHILSTAIDMTERNVLQEQLRQSQKLEAVGTLAGGIAHDFNNILAGIGGFTALARHAAGESRELVDYLDQIARGTQRAAELIKQILTFSRTGNPDLVLQDLHSVVVDAAKLLKAAIPASIEVDTRIAKNIPPVMANATQMHQVIMNLGTNAWQAMRERPGELLISLDHCELGAAQAHMLGNINAGEYLRLAVKDTGSGMSPSMQARIFEPFFTTKDAGEGTGLGLSVVHGIVKAHHGAIRVSSKVGAGSTFEIFLPAQKQSSVVAATPVTTNVTRGHGEHILFVDDEPALVQLAQAMIERLGYGFTGGTTPQDVLQKFQQDPDHFQVVITDQSMPGLTGAELATRIHQLRPELPVILASGFAGVLSSSQLAAAGISEILDKPYGEAELAAAIRAQLSAKSKLD
jgi:PAS domain S-box-containing protein